MATKPRPQEKFSREDGAQNPKAHPSTEDRQQVGQGDRAVSRAHQTKPLSRATHRQKTEQVTQPGRHHSLSNRPTLFEVKSHIYIYIYMYIRLPVEFPKTSA